MEQSVSNYTSLSCLDATQSGQTTEIYYLVGAFGAFTRGVMGKLLAAITMALLWPLSKILKVRKAWPPFVYNELSHSESLR